MKREKPLRRRTKLRPVNPERAAKAKAACFGPQAALARTMPCANCDAPGPSQAAHVRSRGAGGKDEDVIPLCAKCHRNQHDQGWEALAQNKSALEVYATALRILVAMKQQQREAP